MAFLFESPSLPWGLVLLAVCLLSWWQAGRARAFARHNLRFAAALFAAPAIAMVAQPDFPALALAALLLTQGLGAVALGLGVFAILARPVTAAMSALVLALTLALGVLAAITGDGLYAILPVLASAALILPRSVARFFALGILGSVMLGAGGLSLLVGAINPAALFFAAALLSLARGAAVLQTPVT